MYTIHELINNLDEAIATIQRLAELGSAIDERSLIPAVEGQP